MATSLPGSSARDEAWLRQFDRDIRSTAWAGVPVLVSAGDRDLARVVARAIHEGRSGGEGSEFILIGPDTLAERLAVSASSAGWSQVTGAAAPVTANRRWTLCIDGVDELAIPAQKMLLYFLDVLHASSPICWVQVVATASADVASRVADGRFRHDLFYRLNALHIAVPSSPSINARVRAALEHARDEGAFARIDDRQPASIRTVLGR